MPTKANYKMTNKDYERLTFRQNNSGMICGAGLKANSEEIAERLYALEEMIENGTLVFLPCKVGDEFWWLMQLYDGSYIVTSEKVQAIEITEQGISIIAMTGDEWYLSEIYFTREAVEKALEALEELEEKK